MKLIKHRLQNLFPYFILIIISLIFIYPIFWTTGIWKTFDAPFHVSMVAQFHKALQYFHFPVVWTDGVANYGLPFGIIAHPLTSYAGALITFITNDPLQSYKILWLIFTFITSWGMYRLLRRWAGAFPSLAGAILYTLTAYHILNLYVRGALPEYAAAAWLPFLLNTLFEEKEKQQLFKSFIKLTGWYAVIFFTHPMYVLFSAIMTSLFLIFYRPSRLFWIMVLTSALVAIMMNAFYLIPLNQELKYFYMGQESNLLAKGSGLSFNQFFVEAWEYTCSSGDSPAYRCHRVQTGLPETLLLMASPILYFFTKKKPYKKLLVFTAIAGTILTALLIQFVQPMYEQVKLFGSIQFLFRFLNLWILLPPIVLALGLDMLPKYKKIITLLFIAGIMILRVPQLYVKNVTNPDRSIFYFNEENIHSVMMSTIWMGESHTYKKQPSKGAIISGNGKILSSKISPTKHLYTVQNKKEIVFADYTFYFPGWRAYVDNSEIPIQWQDPNHRGYITFTVPEGNHTVETKFTDTKVRLVGKVLSLVTIIVYGASILYFLYKKR